MRPLPPPSSERARTKMSDTPAEGGKLEARLFSAHAPTEKQRKILLDALNKKLSSGVSLTWQQDAEIRSGFRLQIGDDTYDWTEEARMEQLERRWHELAEERHDGLISLIRDIDHWHPSVVPEECGTVLRTGDGIAAISGMDHASYGEILVFENGVRGMVQGLREDRVDCILFGDDRDVAQGSLVRATGRTAGIPVGEGYLGRVVDALGSPMDGHGEIHADGYRPIESPAPRILDRDPVNRPLETGILTIDAMFPIGRGQRELIIGDRQTGKTSIAVDTILNQKGRNVICIYVAIGQKASSVATLAKTLRERGAMDYCVIVAATASATAPMQFIAPYSGCAIGEYFMAQGKDVLIVYDDLSKHAAAYRSLSLLLERSPGREAYPGDVFYIHSRLLERSAQLSREKGGGSLTALPIVETQAGDISAYIPTNVISITDGQLFLETELFFSGQRPAVNVGISVSRVGGAAQSAVMKKAVGSLRLDLAQYREMAVFTQFSSDLDDSTKRQLLYGETLMQLLRQPLHKALSRHAQVILLLAAMRRAFDEVETSALAAAAERLVRLVEKTQPDACREIDELGAWSQDFLGEGGILDGLLKEGAWRHG